VEQAKEHQRDARSFRWLAGWPMDLKLGARMLIKYPGLTLVGGLGMAVAIAIGVGAFSLIHTVVYAPLPLPEGDRLVSLQNWDAAANRPEPRALHDFVVWRDELRSVEDVGAFRTVARNLIASGAPPETVRVAEMTASGFRAARVPPMLGRYLVADDEREGAPAVLLIGFDVWRRRFAADPGIVGRTVQLGEATHAIVGVMPEGFAFPISHGFWIPLRADAARDEPRTGSEIAVFGRLAQGVTLADARSELTTIGQRRAAALPQTHAQLRPQAWPYPQPFSDMDDPDNRVFLHVVRVLVTLLLVVVSINVAILVYARTATRQAEIAVRTALGAGRRRIVGQLFVEALVLAAAAAAAGLVLTAVGLQQVRAMAPMAGSWPFWVTFDLSPRALLYTVSLALLAAAIVGIVPALKATGHRVQSGLQGLSAGGGSRMRLGRTWTLLIVAQVASAVALLPAAVFHAGSSMRTGTADPGFPAEEFLTTPIVLDRPTAPTGADRGDEAFTARFGDRLAELMRRLRAEPGISDVTAAASVPGNEATAWIEAEGVPLPPASEAEASGFAVRAGRFGLEARFNRIDAAFFDAFDVPILAGRAFTAADAAPSATAVIVNRSLARRIAGEGNVLGRRVRYVGLRATRAPSSWRLDRWYEIVGVVPDFPAKATSAGLVNAKLYHAAAPGQLHPVRLALRVRGSDRTSAAGRLREIAAAVDPSLQPRSVRGLDEVLRQEQALLRLVAAVLGVVTLSVLLLSAAGIYALMSLAVSQRRKEIGIRAALGADPRRILASLFSRALTQLGTGAVVGMAAAALLDRATGGELMQGHEAVVLPVVAVVMMMVGLCAALGPARRGLRIQPTEALREE
jgi:predicted permease